MSELIAERLKLAESTAKGIAMDIFLELLEDMEDYNRAKKEGKTAPHFEKTIIQNVQAINALDEFGLKCEKMAEIMEAKKKEGAA